MPEMQGEKRPLDPDPDDDDDDDDDGFGPMLQGCTRFSAVAVRMSGLRFILRKARAGAGSDKAKAEEGEGCGRFVLTFNHWLSNVARRMAETGAEECTRVFGQLAQRRDVREAARLKQSAYCCWASRSFASKAEQQRHRTPCKEFHASGRCPLGRMQQRNWLPRDRQRGWSRILIASGVICALLQ